MVKNIDSDLIRGNIDTIILKTMLDGDKYGLDIIKEVESRSNGTYELKQPTLYSCLKRLENQELISSYWLDSDIGGKRHYYKLTDKGREFFAQKQEEWSKSKFIIDNLLSNFDSDEYRLVKKDDYDKIIEGKTFDYEEQKAKEFAKNNESEDSESNVDEDDEFGINEYNNLLEDESEDDIDEQEDEISDDEDDESDSKKDNNQENDISSPVYLENSNIEDNEDEEDDGKYDNIDVNDVLLSEHEKNLLSKLRFHDDEEINTYYGDKSSYVNYVNINTESDADEESDSSEDEDVNVLSFEDETDNNTNYDDEDENDNDFDEITSDEDADLDNIVAVQQNLLDDNDQSNLDEFESKINNFSKTAKELQNFDSSGETTNEDEFDYVVPKPNEQSFEITDEVEEEVEEDTNLTENFNIKENEENLELENIINIEEEQSNESELTEDYNFNFDEDEKIADEVVIENNNDTVNQEVEINEIEENNNIPDNDIVYSASNTQNLTELDDDFFEELDELSDSSKSTFISSDDGIEYSHAEVDNDIENFTQSEAYENQENYALENETSNIDHQTIDDEDTNYLDDYSLAFKEDSDDFINDNNQMQSTDFSAFDNIISRNADEYSQTTMFAPNENILSFASQKETQQTSVNKVNEDSLNKAKDINSLKEEFEMQGIKVKEFKKYNSHEEATKSYLLVNKINMVSSLILLFGYMFILSAVYIILTSTNYANMSEFSFIPFLYGFIPFGVWAIYNLTKFIISPYKKVPAKYAPGVTIFIAIMITIQLLLITYCVNLQLGFYSFTQANYNHLIWIIPTIISFFPIVSNLIYIALFYSQNFNV